MKTNITTYTGTFEGSTYKSLYPNLYRVRYTSCRTGRPVEYTVIRAATSEGRAREQYNRDPSVTSHVHVELVHTLTPSA